MKLLDDSVSLVIAGAWNHALLNPAWMLKYALQLKGENAVTIATNVLGGSPTTYTLPGLTYSVHANALVMAPTEISDASLLAVQQAALAILSAVPHTPVAAVGYNFGFGASDPSSLLGAFGQAQLDVVDNAPPDWDVVGNKVGTSLSNAGHVLNVDKIYKEETVSLQINLHMPITTTVDASAAIEQRPFADAFNMARELASKITGEELSDDE